MTKADGELLRALHDEHAPALRRYVVGLNGGDRSRAEDVVQETMLRAWRQPQVLDQSHGSVRSWLFTVARRIVIDEWRATRSRREVLTDQPPERARPDETELLADQALIVAALQRLSPDHRQVLALCYLRGLSVEDAALAIGIPSGTVKSRTHYALRALKLALDEIGAGP